MPDKITLQGVLMGPSGILLHIVGEIEDRAWHIMSFKS